MARTAGGQRSASAGGHRRATAKASASRFDSESEWARAERSDRRRAILATLLAHGVLGLFLGISIPAAANRAEASGQSYQSFEVEIPSDERLRRLLSPEPTRAATRLLSPSNTLAARPIEGAQAYELGLVSPSRPALVTTPQPGRFGATVGLFDPRGGLDLQTLQLEDSRRDGPAVLPQTADLGELIGRGVLDPRVGGAESKGPGTLELDGSTAGVVTVYREEVSITEEMRSFGISGSCLVEMRISPNGRVLEARVVTGSGSGWLDTAAQLAARRWRFDPKALERLEVDRCRYWFRALASNTPDPLGS